MRSIERRSRGMVRPRQALGPWLLIGPVLFGFLLFFAIPILYLFASSVNRLDTATYKVVQRFTLFNYQRFLFDAFYFGSLLTTLKISLLVTLVCLVAGYPAAIHLARAPARERDLIMLVLISPLVVSLVIRTFGWLIVLGPSGLVNAVLVGLGLVSRPVKLMYTQTAIVIGLAHVFYPFMVLAIYSALKNVDPDVTRAAQNLGADRMQAFRRVTLPLSVPGMVAGSLIVFALSVSSFVTPSLLGGPWVKVVAFLIWEQNVAILDWPFAAAIAVILLAVTALIMIVYNRLVERTWFAGVFQ
jgi:putative spermidine/putrescine transport system permease protein